MVALDQDVEITKLPKREAAVDGSSQSRSFVGYNGYPMCLEYAQEPQKLSGKEKVALAGGMEVIPKVSKDVFGYCHRTGGIEMPVQKRPHFVSVSCPEQVVPVDIFLDEGSEPVGCLPRPASLGTPE